LLTASALDNRQIHSDAEFLFFVITTKHLISQ